MAQCSSCGGDLPDGRSFCPRCGAPAPDGVLTVHPAAPSAPVYDYRTPVRSGDAVLSVSACLGSIILMSLPVIGFIVQLIWCFAAKNRNRRHLAIAFLIINVIMWLAILALGLWGVSWLESTGIDINDAINSLIENF